MFGLSLSRVSATALTLGVVGFASFRLVNAVPPLPTVPAGQSFTLFMYETPAEYAARTDASDAGKSYWASWGGYRDAMQKAGILRGGMPLQLGDQTRQVRVTDGKRATGVGPVAAGERQVSGYFMIEVPDVEAAVAWAAKAPNASHSVVEVRPGFAAPMPVMP